MFTFKFYVNVKTDKHGRKLDDLDARTSRALDYLSSLYGHVTYSLDRGSYKIGRKTHRSEPCVVFTVTTSLTLDHGESSAKALKNIFDQMHILFVYEKQKK